MRFFLEKFPHNCLYSRNTGGTTDEHYLIDICSGKTGIPKGILYRNLGPFDQVGNQLLEVRTGKGHLQMLRAGSIGGDKRKVDIGAGRVGKLNLCLLGGFSQSLQCHLVAGQVDTVGFLEFRSHPVDDPEVEVVTTKVCITIGRFYLENTVAQFKNGNIEGTTAKVIDGNFLFLAGILAKTIGQGSCCRFIDNTLYIKASNLTGIFCSLALCIIEICGNGNNSLGNRFTEIILSGLFHLLENSRGDFLGRMSLTPDINLDLA